MASPTMKAAVYDRYGDPEVLHYADVPMPQPARGEALIRVHAVGLNGYDLMARAGRYKPNKGKFPHNLNVEGPGVDKQASATLQGGESGDLTVTLQAGSYEFWCSVDSHKEKGMDVKVTVS